MVQDLQVLWGKKNTTKDLVFRLLMDTPEQKIIQLTNSLRKTYGKSVTFQAVRQAVNELVDDEVLTKNDSLYSINPSWVYEAKKTLQTIHERLEGNVQVRGDSIQGDLSVFTFNSINDMQRFWQQIIDNWYKHLDDETYKINCWQGTHLWEALIHVDSEKKVMQKLKNKGVRSYVLIHADTPLDIFTKKFYQQIGLHVAIQKKQRDEAHIYTGTYGELIVQVEYPKELHAQIEDIFNKTKSFEDFEISTLHDITSAQHEIKMTVIKNLNMAKQINQQIISCLEQ